MNYEVRFLVNGEEQTAHIEAETAASAAQIAQETAFTPETEDTFELIQVQLLDDITEYTTAASESAAEAAADQAAVSEH